MILILGRDLGKDRVHGAEGAFYGIHEDPALQVDDGHFLPDGGFDDGEAPARGVRRVVGGPHQPVGVFDIAQDILVFPDVVAAGENIDAHGRGADPPPPG